MQTANLLWNVKYLWASIYFRLNYWIKNLKKQKSIEKSSNHQLNCMYANIWIMKKIKTYNKFINIDTPVIKMKQKKNKQTIKHKYINLQRRNCSKNSFIQNFWERNYCILFVFLPPQNVFHFLNRLIYFMRMVGRWRKLNVLFFQKKKTILSKSNVRNANVEKTHRHTRRI